MKKIMILLLASALAWLPLAGCGSGLESAADRESAPAASADPAESGETEPLCGERIQDGTYAIEVSSSSSMFRVVDARLTVAGAEMWAILTLSGTGYEKLYMGTGGEALADTDDKCVYFAEDGEGRYTYEVPVAALDLDTDVAAWSIRKQEWYDRILVFRSSLIPGDAILIK